MAIRHFEDKAPEISALAYVDPEATVIGDVTIAQQSSIWPGAVLRGDIHRIQIGARTSIQDNCVMHVTHAGPFNPDGFSTTVGDDVTVGHRVILHGCCVQDRCLVGMGSIVMDGATIESHVILGAGSVVSPGKTLEGGYLWLGSPAKRVRPLTEKEIEYIPYSANYYAKLGARHASFV